LFHLAKGLADGWPPSWAGERFGSPGAAGMARQADWASIVAQRRLPLVRPAIYEMS
jgi:hypothetical protein